MLRDFVDSNSLASLLTVIHFMEAAKDLSMRDLEAKNAPYLEELPVDANEKPCSRLKMVFGRESEGVGMGIHRHLPTG